MSNVEEGLPVVEEQPAPQAKSASAVPAGDANCIGLSVVSKKYDLDGDGKLNDAEQAMRDMDKSGKGYLSNEKVYELMQDHLKTQRELFKVKKVVIGLVAFVVILALANLGTSFAAASLAKDTTTNTEGQLVNTKNGVIVSTQSMSETYAVDPVYDAQFSRKLCQEVESGNFTCATDSYLEMDGDIAQSVIQKCKLGKEVRIERLFANLNPPVTVSKKICSQHVDDAISGGSQKSATFFYDNSEQVNFEPLMDGNGDYKGKYKVSGNYLLQDAGRVCELTSDCDSGLGCVSNECVPVASTPPPLIVGSGDECNNVDLVCGSGLTCYTATVKCFNPPCSVVGRCGCADDSVCSSPSLCVDDIVPLDGTDVYPKICGCEIGTSNGCNTGGNSRATWCYGGYRQGECGCKDDGDCTGTNTCMENPLIADTVPQCGNWEFH